MISMSVKTGIVGLPNVGKVSVPMPPLWPAKAYNKLVVYTPPIPCKRVMIGNCAMQSTLFNAICENSKAQAANYPFCTIEPNVGIVAVPDSRLQVLPTPIHMPYGILACCLA